MNRYELKRTIYDSVEICRYSFKDACLKLIKRRQLCLDKGISIILKASTKFALHNV